MLGVHKHGACPILEIANATLSDTVLEVGVDAAMGHTLSEIARVCKEEVFCEAAVVTVVVANSDADAGGEGFEGLFGEKGVISVGGRLDKGKGKASVVVDEDGDTVVAFGCWVSLDLRDEAESGAFELINRDALPRGCGWCDLRMGSFASPSALGGFAKEARGALREWASG